MISRLGHLACPLGLRNDPRILAHQRRSRQPQVRLAGKRVIRKPGDRHSDRRLPPI